MMGKAPSGSFPDSVYASVSLSYVVSFILQMWDPTCVTNTSVVNLDTDFVCLRRGNFNVLEAEFLACFPGDGCLAGDGLQRSHGIVSKIAFGMVGAGS